MITINLLTKDTSFSSLLGFQGDHSIIHLLHCITMHKRSLSPSTISGTKFESEDPLASGRAYNSIKQDKIVLYQSPHPHHAPSSLEIAQANARIANQEVKVAELNVKLAELRAS